MSFFSYLLAITLGVVGVYIIFYFCKLVVEASVGDLRGFGERTKLKRKENLLTTLRSNSGPVSLPHALLQIRQAFFLDIIKHDSSLLDRIETLHTELLSQIISVADEHSRHAPNLPVLEELLDERLSLLHSYIDIRDTSQSIEKRRSEKGREVPSWASDEYSRKLKEVKERLDDNRKSIDSQLKALNSSLSSIATSNEVTYH